MLDDAILPAIAARLTAALAPPTLPLVPLVVDGFAGRSDGTVWVRDRVEGDPARPESLGRELADRMLRAGATEAMAGSTLSG